MLYEDSANKIEDLEEEMEEGKRYFVQTYNVGHEGKLVELGKNSLTLEDGVIYDLRYLLGSFLSSLSDGCENIPKNPFEEKTIRKGSITSVSELEEDDEGED